MTERTLTAMFDSRSAAESARNEVVALGVPSTDVEIRGTEGGAAGAGTPAAEDKGFWASLSDAIFPDEDRHAYEEGIRRGGYLLTAKAPYDMESQILQALERHDPVDIDERTETWRQSGWAGYQSTGTLAADTTATGTTQDHGRTTGKAGLGAASVRSGRDEDTVEVAEEELRVGKREVGGGRVRVRSYVTERPVEAQVSLTEERVQVERRPVDRPVEAGDAVFQEKVIEATERGEEAVVDKRARVVEEVGIRKDVDTHTETVRDTVRKQDVEIEDDRTELPGDRSGLGRDRR